MEDKRQRFEAQVLPHLDAACNFARWLARSAPDADDVVQEAMLHAYRGFDGFRGTDAKPWLLAIVRNCFLTARRRKRHLPLCRFSDAVKFGMAVGAEMRGVRKTPRDETARRRESG